MQALKIVNRQESITKRLFEINKEITALGITKSRVKQRPDTISEELLDKRSELVKEQIALQLEMSELHKQKVSRHDTEWGQQLYRVLEEIIGSAEIKRINREVLNRIAGGEPSRLKINYGYDQKQVDELKRYKSISADLLNKLISARKEVDRYIRQNEPEVNKADYLKSISSLNRCLPPEVELRKIKL